METLMSMPLLSLLIGLSFLGAVAVILFTPSGDDARAARTMALSFSLIIFALSLVLWWGFDAQSPAMQFRENRVWFERLDIGWRLGIDGISLLLILLSTLLTPICILSSFDSVKTRVKEYMAAFLLLECFMIGTFAATDMIVFYVFFEAVLIPMFIIIGVWGGARRLYASFKFFLYTLAGSFLMLLSVLVIYHQAGTADMLTLMRGVNLPATLQPLVWWGLFIAFAVKVPMVPVHTWLPDAHVEAPTAGSVILAGVLLKMGGYGMLRFSLPMLPEASAEYANIVFYLSILAVVYTSLIAYVQTDMKKLIAYSSIAHMGFVTAGLFMTNVQGISGSIFQMLSHGVVSGALFLGVGVLYDRLHTRDMAVYGGLARVMPRFALFMMLFTMAAVGLPGTSGFVGEFLVLLGGYQDAAWLALGLGLGVILSAMYMLVLYRAVWFGAVSEPVAALKDISYRETVVFVPLVLLVLWMGIYPKPFLALIEPAALMLVRR
jgi:NADH-quinone oxidoreductase subunit M